MKVSMSLNPLSFFNVNNLWFYLSSQLSYFLWHSLQCFANKKKSLHGFSLKNEQENFFMYEFPLHEINVVGV